MLLKWWHHNLTITSRFRVFLLLGSSALTQRLVLEHGRMLPEIIFKNNIWDRPLSSLWVVHFDPKICYFWNYVRSSDFAPLNGLLSFGIVCFGSKIVCFPQERSSGRRRLWPKISALALRSSALILFRIVCFDTQGSSAFDAMPHSLTVSPHPK